MDNLIVHTKKDGVAYIQLNRPNAYNSLSLELMRQLITKLDSYAKDTSVRCLIISGEGRGFCAGHDLQQVLSEVEDTDYLDQTFNTCSTLMQRISNLPIPVIAQVHGVATAAGCQLVASCDLAYASDCSRFGTPGVNIGLFCSTPMVALTRTIAPKHALEMLLTGTLIPAEKAQEIGLINYAFPSEKLAQNVSDIALLIASKSRSALSIGKQAFCAQREMSLSDAYQHCSKVMTNNIQTADAKEGINAFLNKRPPKWSHC